MAKNTKNTEDMWRNDLVDLLRERISKHLNKYNLKIGCAVSILKDVICQNGMLRLNFFEQDVVIYKEIVDLGGDLAKPSKRKNVKFYMNKNKTQIIVPSIIIELKYDDVTSHGIIVYSEIAREIKSIFPRSKYYLMTRFTEKHENTIDRHGKHFDSKFMLEKKTTRNKKTYAIGQFKKELAKNQKLATKFDNLVATIKTDLDNMFS